MKLEWIYKDIFLIYTPFNNYNISNVIYYISSILKLWLVLGSNRFSRHCNFSSVLYIQVFHIIIISIFLFINVILYPFLSFFLHCKYILFSLSVYYTFIDKSLESKSFKRLELSLLVYNSIYHRFIRNILTGSRQKRQTTFFVVARSFMLYTDDQTNSRYILYLLFSQLVIWSLRYHIVRFKMSIICQGGTVDRDCASKSSCHTAPFYYRLVSQVKIFSHNILDWLCFEGDDNSVINFFVNAALSCQPWSFKHLMSAYCSHLLLILFGKYEPRSNITL